MPGAPGDARTGACRAEAGLDEVALQAHGLPALEPRLHNIAGKWDVEPREQLQGVAELGGAAGQEQRAGPGIGHGPAARPQRGIEQQRELVRAAMLGLVQLDVGASEAGGCGEGQC